MGGGGSGVKFMISYPKHWIAMSAPGPAALLPGKRPWYVVFARLGGLWSLCRHWRRKTLLFMPEMKPLFPQASNPWPIYDTD